MAGFLPDEGATLITNLLFRNTEPDRGTSLQLALVTNIFLSKITPTASTLTEPTGTGYARITLNDIGWGTHTTSVGNAAGVAVYPKQTFTAGAGGWTGGIYGYAILTTGTSPRIISMESDPQAPVTMNQGDTYIVTPRITVA